MSFPEAYGKHVATNHRCRSVNKERKKNKNGKEKEEKFTV